MKQFYGVFWLLAAISTAMIGNQIHHSFFWCVMDFLFWPFTWAKWLVMHQVNVTIIKSAFAFFFT